MIYSSRYIKQALRLKIWYAFPRRSVGTREIHDRDNYRKTEKVVVLTDSQLSNGLFNDSQEFIRVERFSKSGDCFFYSILGA